MYKCLRCNKEVDEKHARDKIRCPFCGYRILKKSETKVVKKVESK